MICDFEGRAIGYEVRGKGPAVLLLHPFPFDRSFWDRTKLEGFRLVAVDARGFGESSLSGNFALDDLGDDAMRVLDHLGIAIAAGVGCSMGGYVALALAGRHAHRLSALVLVGSRAGADGAASRAHRDAVVAEIRDHGPDAFLFDIGTRLCGRSATAAQRTRTEQLARASSTNFSRALPAGILAMRDRPDRTTLLPQLRLPTLILVGDEDTITPPDEARAMKRMVPGAELEELAGAGHLPSIEVADDFERALSAFLEAHLLAT